MPQIVYVCDDDSQIEYLNPQWAIYTGQEGMATPDSEPAIHPDDRDALGASWERARATRTPLSAQFRLRDRHGRYRWFLTRAVPIEDSHRKRLRWYGTSTDIDEQVRTREALADADRRKDIFLATLAHELRNPLAPIRNAAHVLRSAAEHPERLGWAVDIINRQVAAMGRLLDDLLEVSRITLGTLVLHKERVMLRGVVDAALELARPALDQRAHELTVEGDGLDESLDADPLRLTQVLGNLLNNAARYTDSGGHIRLSVQRRSEGLELAVRDDGIGLEAGDLERVFEMFTQIRPAHERTEGGLGIGLALVRGLVSLHRGQVTAHSDGPGCGSEFRVLLPWLETAEPPVPETGRASAPGGRQDMGGHTLQVLVVDDNRDGADTLAALVESAGYSVRVAYGGQQALDLAAQAPPDVALIDIAMPQLDGEEVARRIRAEPWGARNFLVAITGRGQAEDRQRTLASGFDRHLVKPVDPEQIVDMLADRCHRTWRG